MDHSMRFLLAAIIILTASAGLSDELMVEMECTVTAQTILESDEGKPKTYKGFKGKYRTGDTLSLHFDNLYHPDIFISLWNKKTDSKVMDYYSEAEKNAYKEALISTDLIGSLYISEDQIFINNSSEKLNLKRYYKSDFHGIYVFHGLREATLAQISTLDCRMITDNFDEILNAFD